MILTERQFLRGVQDVSEGNKAVRNSLRRSAPDWYNSDADTWQVPRHSTEDPGAWNFRPREYWPESSALGIILVCLLVLFISLIVRQIVLIRTTREPKTIKKTTHEIETIHSELPMEIAASGNDLETELAKRLDRGDYDGAIIVIYALYLVHLDRAGAITLTRGTTNRGYLRQMCRNGLSSALQNHLAETVSLFESVYFGGKHVDGATVERFKEKLPEFRQLPTALNTTQGAL